MYMHSYYSRLLLLTAFTMVVVTSYCQTAWFIDGYHGGVYGHYPKWKTRFILEQLQKNPDWKINLEIEPETWDSVRAYDPEAYAQLQRIIADPAYADRIEVVNPSFGQSYLYNISGESVIRQFSFGIARTRAHFPSLTFLSYSSEEPCFTSALPQILASFGFKYAVLKNPNTCWGGYTRAYGGEKVNWVGPDGTSIPTVTRYAAEALEPGSTWQTTAWSNSERYVRAALSAGIEKPVGMCLQDAGWKHGPWLATIKDLYKPSVYTLWRDYFGEISTAPARDSWRLSQEDIQVSLVWGAQVLQRLAQQVRAAENKVVVAEKIATLNSVFNGSKYPLNAFNSAWRTLLLGQHHDCWIVPYNGRAGNTWADKTKVWTDHTLHQSDSVIYASLFKGPTESLLLNVASENKNIAASEGNVSVYNTATSERNVVSVYNTTASARNEVISIPWTGSDDVSVFDEEGKAVPMQVVPAVVNDLQQRNLVFAANVLSVGRSTYMIKSSKEVDAGTKKSKAPGEANAGAKKSKGLQTSKRELSVRKGKENTWFINTPLYEIIIDGNAGGMVKSLKAKLLNNKEFVDTNNGGGFNELRGFFYEQNKFLTSRDKPATVSIMEDGPVRCRISIKGLVGEHEFEQILTLESSNPRIDIDLTINWKGNPGIGKYSQAGNYKATDLEKAFYNDQYKMLALFPANLKSPKVYKDAPFDVTESRLDNTFFNRWDSIKNNVMVSWVDLAAQSEDFGLALFTDHTTSYAFGNNHPLGLTLQYSGVGLWGRNYRITGPTRVRYALLPHQGKWDAGEVSGHASAWKEPLIICASDRAENTWSRSWMQLSKGWELSALQKDGDHVLVRIFNAAGEGGSGEIIIDDQVDGAEQVELNGATTGSLPVVMQKESSVIRLNIPRFGIRTIRLKLKP